MWGRRATTRGWTAAERPRARRGAVVEAAAYLQAGGRWASIQCPSTRRWRLRLGPKVCRKRWRRNAVTRSRSVSGLHESARYHMHRDDLARTTAAAACAGAPVVHGHRANPVVSDASPVRLRCSCRSAGRRTRRSTRHRQSGGIDIPECRPRRSHHRPAGRLLSHPIREDHACRKEFELRCLENRMRNASRSC